MVEQEDKKLVIILQHGQKELIQTTKKKRGGELRKGMDRERNKN